MKGGLLLNRFLKGAGFYLLLFAIIIGIVQFSGTQTTKVEELVNNPTIIPIKNLMLYGMSLTFTKT